MRTEGKVETLTGALGTDAICSFDKTDRLVLIGNSPDETNVTGRAPLGKSMRTSEFIVHMNLFNRVTMLCVEFVSLAHVGHDLLGAFRRKTELAISPCVDGVTHVSIPGDRSDRASSVGGARLLVKV